MTNFRNIIILILLAIFFTCYGSFWAYRSLYREPRKELGDKIQQYRQGLDRGKSNIVMMQQVSLQNIMLYCRSMPRTPNSVRTLYPFWFRELLKYCEIEEGNVDSDQPSRLNFGVNYRFHVRGVGSLDQWSRVLFEFYHTPYLHRITAMSVTPLEGDRDRVSIALTVDAVAVRYRLAQDPFPLAEQLPILDRPLLNHPPLGHRSRLTQSSLDSYDVIAQRNLLQVARGGVDRADYTYLTGINKVGDQTEVWLTVRTDNNRVVRVSQGDTVQIGSFFGKVLEILDQRDVVFEHGGTRWLVSLGDCLNQAFALPLEAQ